MSIINNIRLSLHNWTVDQTVDVDVWPVPNDWPSSLSSRTWSAAMNSRLQTSVEDWSNVQRPTNRIATRSAAVSPNSSDRNREDIWHPQMVRSASERSFNEIEHQNWNREPLLLENQTINRIVRSSVEHTFNVPLICRSSVRPSVRSFVRSLKSIVQLLAYICDRKQLIGRQRHMMKIFSFHWLASSRLHGT